MLLEFILDSTSLIFMSKDNDMDLLSLKDGSRLKAYQLSNLAVENLLYRSADCRILIE